ncbi:FtsK/SpoIIIE family protein [Streptomyces sp. ADI92-24]|uniref:FtsK/SpoIIIE domain-containing protein n=1 Tax=Streptomyces sp. ADI92-24 TaxID=1522756 RepID=UPI000F5552A7|nr:FtsK/SpoIIIE domain-containing protein [Streptomyces sp. ADI92-24]RPK32290.1 FtsK/SpoIIIE family protein [Streptomyces sp. ADI92-24]
MWNTTKKSTVPQQLRLTDPGIREQLQALPASQVLIALGTDRQPVGIDLDNDSPHVLVCSAFGGGTSTVLRTLATQFLHHGGDALVLDPKRISHLWAKSLPTVTHRGNIARIHDALVNLASELERRLDLEGDLDDVPRLIVAVDEANTTLRQLTRY